MPRLTELARSALLRNLGTSLSSPGHREVLCSAGPHFFPLGAGSGRAYVYVKIDNNPTALRTTIRFADQVMSGSSRGSRRDSLPRITRAIPK